MSVCECAWACVDDDDDAIDDDVIDDENNVVKYTTKWAKCLTILIIFDKIIIRDMDKKHISKVKKLNGEKL